MNFGNWWIGKACTTLRFNRLAAGRRHYGGIRYSCALSSSLSSSLLLLLSSTSSNLSGLTTSKSIGSKSNLIQNRMKFRSFTSSSSYLERSVVVSLLALASSTSAFITHPTLFHNYSTRTTSTTTTTTITSMMCSSSEALSSVASRLENSWIRDLNPETPENLEKSLSIAGNTNKKNNNNKTKRPVFNGHYVLVEPTGISKPRLILYSHDVAHNLLKMEETVPNSDDFVNWVSGNLKLEESWATPYALSIMGTRYTNNCPYGTGNGYGDGRAISIGEFAGQELQLKGGGTTPFHRGADGRAVLRSSIREFLASEAMHWLRVPTTRALSLVVSETDQVQRPWYAPGTQITIPNINDSRLAQYSHEQKKQILQQLRHQNKADPNILVAEPAAITCRVCSSFTRIGHLDLFARRVEQTSMEAAARKNDPEENSNKRYDTSTLQWQELEQMIWHACYREYKDTAYTPNIDTNNLAAAADTLLRESAHKLATMVGHWIRVGFVQGNFNADNCLVGGKTMDYGPFGFVEEYNPVAAKWTGSGQHFGFLNQPSAALANYKILVESVVPVIYMMRNKNNENNNNDDDDNDNNNNESGPEALVDQYMEHALDLFDKIAVEQVYQEKMGLYHDDSTETTTTTTTTTNIVDQLWSDLEPLLRSCRADWTVFWRELTYTVRDFPYTNNNEDENEELYEQIFDSLANDNDEQHPSPFYEPVSAKQRSDWIQWIAQWRSALVVQQNASNNNNNHNHLEDIYKRMLQTNPKYVLREWMLVDAYTKAARGDESELHNLYALIQKPYEEGSDEQIQKYYRRAPEEALVSGGTAFMS